MGEEKKWLDSNHNLMGEEKKWLDSNHNLMGEEKKWLDSNHFFSSPIRLKKNGLTATDLFKQYHTVKKVRRLINVG